MHLNVTCTFLKCYLSPLPTCRSQHDGLDVVSELDSCFQLYDGNVIDEEVAVVSVVQGDGFDVMVERQGVVVGILAQIRIPHDGFDEGEVEHVASP